MKMKQIMMLLAAMLLTACSKDDEVKAATVQEAGKTLLVEPDGGHHADVPV